MTILPMALRPERLSQKVKTLLPGSPKSGLRLVPGQSQPLYHLPSPVQCLRCPLAAQFHEVDRVVDHMRPGGAEPVRVLVASRSVRPSPFLRRVGVHNFISEPAQGSLALQPAGLLSHDAVPLSQGSGSPGCPVGPLVSYQTYRLISEWVFQPPAICTLGAHRDIRVNYAAL
jgi:hypothetical protein